MSNESIQISYVKCPTCQKGVRWGETSPFRPFCSKRCQLIDLGEWANETHTIPSDDPLDDLDNSLSQEHYE